MTIEHRDILAGQMHAPHNWVVADEAARLALVPTASDLGKHLWQQDDDSEWLLAAVDPAIRWKRCGSDAGIKTAMSISGHAAVALDATGQLIYADCTNAAHLGAVLGVTVNAYATGAEAEVHTAYTLTHAGWSFAPGPVLVGAGGALVQALPAGAVFAQVIGTALSATVLHINPQPPILLS